VELLLSQLGQWLSAVLGQLWNALRNQLVGTVQWAWQKVYEWAVFCLEWVMGLLPANLQEWLSEDRWGSVKGLATAVSWFIPIWTLVGIWAVSLLLCGAIRLARWVKACVPVIFGPGA
jgi:hypothetical protein